jgi:hypothetical protein
MTQVGLHSISVNGGRAEGESSAVLDDQHCQSGKMEAFGRLAASSLTVHLTVEDRTDSLVMHFGRPDGPSGSGFSADRSEAHP